MNGTVVADVADARPVLTERAQGSSTHGVSLGSVFPAPTDEEAAAIAAAVELAWPRTVLVVANGPTRSDAPSWRWSGRWWNDGLHRRSHR